MNFSTFDHVAHYAYRIVSPLVIILIAACLLPTGEASAQPVAQLIKSHSYGTPVGLVDQRATTAAGYEAVDTSLGVSVAPTVTISAALPLTTSAVLRGNITATGGENATVTFYWGLTDGKQIAANWTNNATATSPAQPQGVGAFSLTVTGLTPLTTYRFSAAATNTGGTGWPAASGTFTTARDAYAFGDSITQGVYGATIASGYYVPQVAAIKGWTVANLAMSGNETPDFFPKFYSVNTANTTASISLLGYNDMRHLGENVTAQRGFERALYSAMVWLSTPRAGITLAQSSNVVYTGSWYNNSAWGGNKGRYSSQNGATASFSVTGQVVYVDIVQYTGSTRGIQVSIDGVNKGTFEGSAFVPTVSGTRYAPYLLRFGGLANSAHSVVLTVTNGTGNAYFNWATGSSGARNGAHAYLGNTLHMNATGYTLMGPTKDNGSDLAVSQFNAIISKCAATLWGDGLNVHYVDADAAYDIATDVYIDNIHPNETGYRHLAAAFLSVIDSASVIYVPITAGADDGRRYTGTLGFGAGALISALGHDSRTTNLSEGVFVRFSGVAIPGTVKAAYLLFHQYAATVGSPSVRIYGVNTDNAPPPTSAAEFDAAALTSTYVVWPGPTVAGLNKTPSLAAIVQVLVTGGKLASEAVQFQIKDNIGSGNNYNQIEMYDHAAYLAPKLYIQYVGQSGPTLIVASPNQGVQGQNIVITITGTNLSATTSVSFGSGIAVNTFAVNDSTHITANVTVSASAIPGPRDVLVTTPGGIGALPSGFTVRQAPPTLTATSPNLGYRGQNLVISIAGTSLSGATAVAFGQGITVKSFAVVSSTRITANITIGRNAKPGPRDVSVTTLAGTGTLTRGFTVR